MLKISIPASVPRRHRWQYVKNWRAATRNTGRLMLLAGDQKIEHLNDDFFGRHISLDDATPAHLFNIASLAHVGVLATHLGLIAAYGRWHPEVPYLVKLNGKTNLISTKTRDPLSLAFNSVTDVHNFKKDSGLKIVGIGYTLYPGSQYESQMLAEAGRIVYEAHRRGLLAVLWIYPRGQAVKNETDAHLAAGMAGLGANLGADFVKLSYPRGMNKTKMKEIVAAAGRTGVIFSGGEASDPKKFLNTLAFQIANGARGNATGRNIHQRPIAEAVRFADAISAVSLYDYSAEQAYKIYLGKAKLK
jgi:fructose-bisphosphate aldolase/6-deoxy-5-ketofructose 1-phosphate synthase